MAGHFMFTSGPYCIYYSMATKRWTLSEGAVSNKKFHSDSVTPSTDNFMPSTGKWAACNNTNDAIYVQLGGPEHYNLAIGLESLAPPSETMDVPSSSDDADEPPPPNLHDKWQVESKELQAEEDCHPKISGHATGPPSRRKLPASFWTAGFVYKVKSTLQRLAN